ncbi:3206_t:CDS:1, partial [Racocetra fulgida]
KDGTKDEANTSEKERLFDTSKENEKYSNVKKRRRKYGRD